MILRYPLSNKLAEFLKVQPSAPGPGEWGGNSTCKGSEGGGVGLWGRAYLEAQAAPPRPPLGQPVGSNGRLGIAAGNTGVRLPGQGL